MWLSKKRWEALEKKVADLEKKVQNQPLEIIGALNGYQIEQISKAKLPLRQKRQSRSDDEV